MKMGPERWQDDIGQLIFRVEKKIFGKHMWTNVFKKGYLKKKQKIFKMAKIFEKDGVRKVARRAWTIHLSGWEQFCFRIIYFSTKYSKNIFEFIFAAQRYFRRMGWERWQEELGKLIFQVESNSVSEWRLMYLQCHAMVTVSCVSYFGHCILGYYAMVLTVSMCIMYHVPGQVPQLTLYTRG